MRPCPSAATRPRERNGDDDARRGICSPPQKTDADRRLPALSRIADAAAVSRILSLIADGIAGFGNEIGNRSCGRTASESTERPGQRALYSNIWRPVNSMIRWLSVRCAGWKCPRASCRHARSVVACAVNTALFSITVGHSVRAAAEGSSCGAMASPMKRTSDCDGSTIR